MEFYGGLFGWQFEDVLPEGAPGRYVIATLDGLDVAALSGPGTGSAAWTTYVAVDDVDAAAAAMVDQVTNTPGAWSFSDLHTTYPAAAGEFYTQAFGWRVVDQGWGPAIQVPGYGDHLEATTDPDIRARQASAPAGFEDVIGGIAGLGDGEHPHWHVTFTVADRDEAAATTERLGGTVVSTDENDWTRTALVRDPQGGALTLSQFAPKDWG